MYVYVCLSACRSADCLAWASEAGETHTVANSVPADWQKVRVCVCVCVCVYSMCVFLWEYMCLCVCVRVRGLVCVGQASNNYVKLSLSSINHNTSASVLSL